MHASDPVLAEAGMRLPALRGGEPEGGAEAEFTRALVEASRSRKSWRERLQWIRDRFSDSAFAPTPGQLATVAVYLRFLATGELRCQEDGRHYRPKHHAEAALQIETALERLSTPETAWIVRRIYPYLPSWNEEFRRSEPLTRIRDIAHRNDIPSELKQEIKHRLQNKLHRCAGPEDLLTAEEILGRITAAGAGYPPAFVQEFEVFHGELQEFFNATALEARLRALARSFDAAVVEAVSGFLALKAEGPVSDGQLLDLLERLTALRQLFAEKGDQESPQRRSQLRLADIGLEDYAFALLSECSNRLQDLAGPGAWAGLLRALAAALDNLRLSLIEPEECAALRSEVTAWAGNFHAQDRFHLLRLVATLSRARRLAETYTDRINHLFLRRAEELGLRAGDRGTGDQGLQRGRHPRPRPLSTIQARGRGFTSAAAGPAAASVGSDRPGRGLRDTGLCGDARGSRGGEGAPPAPAGAGRRRRGHPGVRGRHRAGPPPAPSLPPGRARPAGTPPVRRVRGAGTPQGL